jgi:hypothetical protein
MVTYSQALSLPRGFGNASNTLIQKNFEILT